MTKLVGRATAIQTREKRYQGNPCKYGHDGVRYTSTGGCVQCVAAQHAGKPKGWQNAHLQADPRTRAWFGSVLRARKKGIPVGFERWQDLPKCPKRCWYTGEEFDFSGTHHPNTPSLDRFVPHWGYVPGNVRWCTTRINAVKSDRTPMEWWAYLEEDLDYIDPLRKQINGLSERTITRAETRDYHWWQKKAR